MTADADERRYTGAHHDDGAVDCSAGDSRCEYEYDTTCDHCGTRVREHHDEDGTPILVEPS